MPISRTSPSTQHPAKCIKAPMVGKKPEEKAVGVSKGGRNTKIHALVDGLGNPLAFLLSPGNDHDSKHAVSLLGQVNIEGSNVLGDKAYGAKAIRDYIESQEASYTIPPKNDVLIRGPLIGMLTRKGTWLNASFRNSNGSAECSLAMRNSMSPS